LDVLVLMDELAFPSCKLTCRLVGVVQGEQGDKKEIERNDRVVAVERGNHSYAHVKRIDDLFASGRGVAKMGNRSLSLRAGTLFFIEHGGHHEIRNNGRVQLKTLKLYVPPAYTKAGDECRGPDHRRRHVAGLLLLRMPEAAGIASSRRQSTWRRQKSLSASINK
jgi:mannose-6-phosphate isomerase-like protein (cupin superfamily)